MFDGDLTIKIMDLIWLCLNTTGICVDHLRFGTDRGVWIACGFEASPQSIAKPWTYVTELNGDFGHEKFGVNHQQL